MYALNKVDKRFPGVHALKAVDFQVGRGEIVGLVGENGAGKSTLMKIIYGAYQPDGGTITIDGTTMRFQNPRQAMNHGIGMVFQEQSLITNLTVMENIFLGCERQFVRFGIVDWRAMAKAARHQLAKVNLDVDPAAVTSQLSFVQRQLVELAKVLALEERIDGDLVILLDEPTSVLAKEEVELLFRLVRDLARRASFIFVSHRIDEVLELSDRIYVMKDGAVVDVAARDDADVDDIQHKMVGREIDKEYYREQKQAPYAADEPLIRFDSVSVENRYRDISFDLHRGEVLCLVGTEGSGREAVLRTIFGLETPTAGTVTIKHPCLGSSADSAFFGNFRGGGSGFSTVFHIPVHSPAACGHAGTARPPTRDRPDCFVSGLARPPRDAARAGVRRRPSPGPPTCADRAAGRSRSRSASS